MLDIITMGSNKYDTFINTDAELIDIRSKAGDEELIAYPVGSKIQIKELHYDVGGNGVNVAVGVSRIGLKTGYIGKIGRDSNGDAILKRIKEEKIQFLGSRGEQNGLSIILDTELDPDRTILTFQGCNDKLKASEIKFSKLKAKWIYLSSLLDESYKTMLKVVEHAKKNDIKIAFGPSSTISRKGIDFVKGILNKTDLLILNDGEAEDLVGKGTPEENILKLYKMGIETVVITMGEEGLIAAQDDKIYTAKPSKKVNILETTGAGDACSSGILAGMILGKDIETCIKMGMSNSESVLSHYGAHNKLLNRKEMEKAAKNDRREIKSKSL